MSKTINILIVIDTDAVLKNYGTGNSDPNNPKGIAHNMGFMIATGTTINSGQGTGDLDFNALVGDTVRAFATSGSDNFEAAVLLYGMPKFSGDQVFGTFIYQNFQKSTIIPNSATTPLPAAITEETFWFYQAGVAAKGVEGYMVQFGLYTRDPNTGQPVLNGYYAWDPTIRVVG
jgi:hypothetical protein